MKFGSKSLGKSLILALLAITAVAIAFTANRSQDIRGGAVYTACGNTGDLCSNTSPCCAGLSCSLHNGLFVCQPPAPTPVATVTPTLIPGAITVVTLTSGACNSYCVTVQGTCLSVGTDTNGTNGNIMTWGSFSSCFNRRGLCISSVTRVPSGKVKCSGSLPEWTNCRCQLNPYAQ